MKPMKLGLIGANGRLGSLIEQSIERDYKKKFQLTAKISSKNSSSFSSSMKNTEVWLDVSRPEASIRYLHTLKKKNLQTPYIIGCTGWSEAQFKQVQKHASFAPVLYASNFSTSVTLLQEIIEQIAPTLSTLGYDVVLNEIHHRQKKDKPSGTAKSILKKLGNKFEPQVHVSRCGKVVGTHELQFIGDEDVLTLKHEALDRKIFAKGALMAALWMQHVKAPGLYSMREVLLDRRINL